MAEFSLLASAAFPPAILLQEHQGLFKNLKEFQNLLPLNIRKQDVFRSGSIQFNAQNVEDLGRPMPLLSDNSQYARLSPMIEKSLLIDMQGSHPDSVLFSLRIAEKCIRNEKIMKFLMSGSKFAEGHGLDISLLSEVMGLQDVTIDMLPSPNGLVDDEFPIYEADINDSKHPLHLHKQIYAPEPQLDFVRSLSDNSYFTVHADGRILFADSAAQIEDLLSIVSEFNVPKKSVIGSKQSLLVPYFTSRKGRGRPQTQKQVPSPTVAPSKSPGNAKLKTLPKKKKNKKLGKEHDLYDRNGIRACESLLSLILDKNGNSIILSVKKSGSEISELLTQFSAVVAGTGLAVIVSVLLKLACGRVPWSATRLMNTGFGFGLFWVSWAIIGLRDAITFVSKNLGKMNFKEEEIASTIERSTKDILFRAVVLLAVTVLRFG
ncbi:hypothetical protein Cni_G24815 [Canna indica]|uniref:Uncharacterized protein n=1 Tax=Canna indica TaxID=4628 RepID=A0AAQ3QNK3_9LILI|nr:hypothetical protein Cni_G24815 [Canna indica]